MAVDPVEPTPYRRPVAVAPAATTTVARPSAFGLVARIVLTLLGAAGMIVGAFMAWTGGIAGVNLTWKAFWSTAFTNTGAFVMTVGFVFIVLGLLAIVGLAPRSGWLTRLAGVLGIVGFILFVIELYRGPGTLPDGGAWVALAGSVVALIGGFLGTRPRVVTTAPEVATVP